MKLVATLLIVIGAISLLVALVNLLPGYEVKASEGMNKVVQHTLLYLGVGAGGTVCLLAGWIIHHIVRLRKKRKGSMYEADFGRL